MVDNGASFLSVINAPEFKAAWQKIVDEPLTYDQFCTLPMPDGISRRDLWGAFSLLKRCTGESSDMKPWFKGIEKNQCWSYTPKSVEQDFLELSAIASPDSSLNLHVSSRGFVGAAFIENVIEEVSSLARRDGLPVPEEAIRSIWLRRRPPSDRYEAVIENVRELFDNSDRLAKKRYSILLADDIHDAIAQGTQGLAFVRKLHFDAEYYEMDCVNDPEFAQDAFLTCIANANKAQTFKDIILAAIITADTLWDVPVWPEFNALTEFILRRTFFMQKSVPALSFIPLSSKDDLGLDGFSKMHERESSNTPSQGLDSTWLYAGQVRILLNGAKELLQAMKQIEGEQARARSKIDSVDWLNARQRNLLLALRKAPRRSVKINDYAAAFKVAYATARQDLLELEQHGLLVKSKFERTFVFRLSDRINW